MTASRRVRLAIVLVGVLVVAAVAYVGLRPVTAPEATFVTIQGEALPTSSLRGKVVLVNFWATSCVICMKEMPRLVQTHAKFQGREFETIAVAMPYDPPNQVIAYAKRTGLPFRVAIDPNGEAVRGFGDVRFTPTTFVLDREGRVLKRYVGEPDFAELERVIEAALKKAG
jgi:peroxiredoxin